MIADILTNQVAEFHHDVNLKEIHQPPHISDAYPISMPWCVRLCVGDVKVGVYLGMVRNFRSLLDVNWSLFGLVQYDHKLFTT